MQLDLAGTSGLRRCEGSAKASNAALLRGEVDAVNQLVSNRLRRKPVRLPSEPDSLAGVSFAHWNGLAVQADNQHWPLIPVRVKHLCHVVVQEASHCGAVASDSPSGESKRSEERRVGKECRSRWSPYH